MPPVQLCSAARKICLIGLLGALPMTAVAGTDARAEDSVELSLTLRSDLAAEVGARAAVRFNGSDLGSLSVDGSSREYSLSLPRAPKMGDTIDVRFTNDAVVNGQDRNLYVESISAGGSTATPTEDGVTYDIGDSWEEATDGEDVRKAQTAMKWNGALRFTWGGQGMPTTGIASTDVSRSGQPFAGDSFWYQQIPADAAIHSDSSGLVSVLNEDVAAHAGASVNTTSFAPPIYVVSDSVPRVKVRNSLCNGPTPDPDWLDREWGRQFNSVPVPPEAAGAEGGDSEIVIWSPSTDEVWEMWRFESSSSGYQACWGGKIANASKSDGLIDYPFGVTASGLSLLGSTIRISELQAGRIDHAIGIGINRPRKDVFSWPATRTDGTWESSRAIPEGMRFRLDPSVDIDSLGLTPIGKIIAKAAQEYGFVVRDNTNGPVVIYAEDSTPYTAAGKSNPYTDMFGSPQYYWMRNFPWDRMQAMPLNYGKP